MQLSSLQQIWCLNSKYRRVCCCARAASDPALPWTLSHAHGSIPPAWWKSGRRPPPPCAALGWRCGIHVFAVVCSARATPRPPPEHPPRPFSRVSLTFTGPPARRRPLKAFSCELPRRWAVSRRLGSLPVEAQSLLPSTRWAGFHRGRRRDIGSIYSICFRRLRRSGGGPACVRLAARAW